MVWDCEGSWKAVQPGSEPLPPSGSMVWVYGSDPPPGTDQSWNSLLLGYTVNLTLFYVYF